MANDEMLVNWNRSHREKMIHIEKGSKQIMQTHELEFILNP